MGRDQRNRGDPPLDPLITWSKGTRVKHGSECREEGNGAYKGSNRPKEQVTATTNGWKLGMSKVGWPVENQGEKKRAATQRLGMW